MVNCVLFYQLISAIKEGAKLIVCGDYAQLPPIGAGNIFSDLLHMDDCFNVSILRKVHRQAEASGILTDANKIREGIFPIEDPTQHPKKQIINGELKDMAYVFRDNNERIQDIVVSQFLKIKDKYGLDSVAVAVPRKDTVVNSSLEINKQIQMNVIDTENTPFVQGYANKFYIGDRILQTENDGKRDIYNGEIGYVENVFPNARKEEVCMVARFKSTLNGEDKIIEYNKEELGSVLLGYALTSHKLQGSEYDYIIVAIDNTHYVLLDRCMLYTAITRAKKMCILVSQPEAFKHAMKYNKVNSRQTWLSLKYEGGLSA
jgi:exodeoxyribonuclease V alpha subunit